MNMRAPFARAVLGSVSADLSGAQGACRAVHHSQVSARAVVLKSYEGQRDQFVGAPKQGSLPCLPMREYLFRHSIMYIVISTIHDDPKQCEHVLS